MKVVNKRLLVTQGGATIVRGRIYEQTQLGDHKTRLTVKAPDGGWPTKVIVPDGLIERGTATYKGAEFKIY
ncbi:hypothetical protein [Escherichia phage EP75]|jgi:hypothetical protein|uniref:Uncharacterized protein n=1 Tax=Escherichia phage EP75 TaxID=2070200 RepID=A0A2Z3DPH5_9CAUD|nr:hypothetical protein HYP60_gp163 [Escherichia phage EP75]YP_009966801.1 hypothetical protein HYQ27_gp079 [Salmonella phage Se-J]AVZ45037.1 hypothetical protein [Escherichia phage EP75]